MRDREIEEVGDEPDSKRPQVLQVKNSQAVRTCRRRVLTAFDGIHRIRLGERGKSGVEGIIGFDISYNFTGIRIILVIPVKIPDIENSKKQDYI